MTAPSNLVNKNQNKNYKRVGFLATGSELITGEILNTNSQAMADAMLLRGISIGEHLIVDDDVNNIKEAFRFLLSRHDAVISTGGLGPTSDDVTRNAITEVLGLELVFDSNSFQRITDRILKKYTEVPVSNKRQAYFPEGSLIIPNENGTADACEISFKNNNQTQWVYLLPGPPRECLPIFTNTILPSLIKNNFETDRKLYRWRLQGVSEAKIAEQLEEALKEFNLIFGYRAHAPYLDIKLNLSPGPDLSKILEKVESLVGPYISKD